MKTTTKKIFIPAAIGLFLLMLVPCANAQHGGHRGAGVVARGGSHYTGGFRSGVLRGGFHGGFYHGFYGYPRIGFRTRVLPFGFYSFYWGPEHYYYYGGIFYLPYNGGYQVVVPPVGAVVLNLPDGAQSITIDGQLFYEFNGVYYKDGVDDKGKKVYVVAGKDGVLNTNNADDNDGIPAIKVGDIVNQLPEGCRKISISDKTYFVSPFDVYYESFKDANNNKAYRVVSIPPKEPDGE